MVRRFSTNRVAYAWTIKTFAMLCLARDILAGELNPLDACGALAASADETADMEDMVKKLSGGFSVAQAVAKCNENKDLCQRVRMDP